jgi:hypothetical protein
MKAQLDNILMSSMIYWMDNTLLLKGEAFTNFAGKFYEIKNLYSNLYTYGLPFKQIVADNTITGANLLSGVYINNTFVTVGQSGLSGINPNQGQVYFSTDQSSNQLSGKYAVKDFNLYLTSKAEEEILFETQYKIRPKTTQNLTGLAPNSITCPAIFIKNNGGVNEPFGFGGEDRTEMDIRVIILSDTIYNLDAVISIFRDKARTYIPLVNISESPYNSLNSINDGYYSYNTFCTGKIGTVNSFFIDSVSVSKIPNFDNKLNPDIFAGFIDFTISNIRYPRV